MDSRTETLKHIRNVQARIAAVAAELLRRSMDHDASKLEPPEVAVYDEFTPLLAATTYGSPEYAELLSKIRPALDHHYLSNRHHPEHWTAGIRGMSLCDLVEMICDWAAASQRHTDGDVRRSIEINQKRFGYADQLRSIFLNTVDELEGRGRYGSR